MMGFAGSTRPAYFPRADKASLREFKQVREALESEGKGGARKKIAAGKVAKK
jgi:hypothetical protein